MGDFLRENSWTPSWSPNLVQHSSPFETWLEVIIKSTGKLIAKAILGHGRIYIIQTHQPPKYSTHSAKSKSIDINVLHCCWLGHLGFENVCKLVSGNMIEDIQQRGQAQVALITSKLMTGRMHRWQDLTPKLILVRVTLERKLSDLELQSGPLWS